MKKGGVVSATTTSRSHLLLCKLDTRDAGSIGLGLGSRKITALLFATLDRTYSTVLDLALDPNCEELKRCARGGERAVDRNLS